MHKQGMMKWIGGTEKGFLPNMCYVIESLTS